MKIGFDADPFAYYWLLNVSLIFTAFILLFVYNSNKQISRSQNYLFLVVSILFLVLYRLPIIVFNQGLNPDESWLLVGAMTLNEYPIIYESVNCETSGPLNFYCLSWFINLTTDVFDYVSARIYGIVLLSASFLFLFKALKNFFSTQVSVLTCFLGTIWVGNFILPDFVHLSSEHLPILFICLMIYAFSSLEAQDKPNYYFIIIGLITSFSPITKLQALPVFIIIGLFTFFYIFNYQTFAWRKSGYYFLGILLGFSSYIAAMCYFDVLDDFFKYYIQFNLQYQNTKHLFPSLSTLQLFLQSNDEKVLTVFFVCLLISLLLFIHNWLRNLKRDTSIFLLALSLVSIYVVLKPGTIFQHYLLFLIVPILLIIGQALYFLLEYNKTTRTLAVLGIACLSIYIGSHFNTSNEFITKNATAFLSKSENPMVVEVLKYAKLTEKPSLFVHGEGGRYYLASELVQGVPWSFTIHGVYDEGVRRRIMHDLVAKAKQNKPTVFIDTHKADKKALLNRFENGYEKTPFINELIKLNYTFVKEINGERLFVRKDLVDAK